ncbi:uncharacterized protein LOC132544427 [Ylistrum balloti]|uniref:uncharacterized protein LOC132544427 n=1 Tax=Ylistrum balloti TaxID=509963 RepID=UPI002905B3A1|nr:uncharacterized protein LOC132544427 [Ylistrum balloti]
MKNLNLYNARTQLLPNLPKTRQEILLEGKWRETSVGEQFLLFDEGEEQRMIAFATTENLRMLSNADAVFCDGTFYTCPGLFTQLYTIHAMEDGVMYPLIFVLLPGKSQLIYTNFFRKISDTMDDLLLPFNPATVFLDFEAAAQNDIRTVYPGTTVKWCFFHYTQCIWRKAQQYGLQVSYGENEDVHRLLRRAAVLPIIPPERVEDVWFNALEDLEDSVLPVNTTPFCDYVTTQWVEGGDINTWNHYTTEGPRTTNHLKGWNSKLKK